MRQNLEIKLNKKDIRPTAMRLLVMDVLSSQEAADILFELEKSLEKSDLIQMRLKFTLHNRRLNHDYTLHRYHFT